jgi:hypothetical protein
VVGSPGRHRPSPRSPCSPTFLGATRATLTDPKASSASALSWGFRSCVVLFVDEECLARTFDTRLDPFRAEPSLRPPVPRAKAWVHPTVDQRPFRASPTSPFARLPGLSAGSDFPGVSAPYNGIFVRAPDWSGSSATSLRLRPQAFSASRRFSQARVLRPCLMPQPFLDCPPSSLPLTRIACPSRDTPLGAACSLAVIRRRAERRRPWSFAAGFPRRPHPGSRSRRSDESELRSRCPLLGRVGRVPPPTMGPLSARRLASPGGERSPPSRVESGARTRLPVTLDLERRWPLVPSASPASKP